MSLTSIVDQLYVLPILFLSVVVHENAHGLIALWCGDPTAKQMGRITLNPIPHIDPVGTILVPLFSLLAAGRVFIAWAKPVPVNPLNFRNYRRDDILVSIAGPLSNLLMAGICTLTVAAIIGFHTLLGESFPDAAKLFLQFLINTFYVGIYLNVVLAVFNIIPVPPLDGSHIVASLLPPGIGERYRRIGFIGVFVVIFLMRVPVFDHIFSLVINTLVYPYALVLQMLT
ncbi:MAG: site-2 protease family protein [Bacteroidota bacterium]